MTESDSNTVPTADQKCQRCGVPTENHPNFARICDECYSIYGSCCNEWEDPANEMVKSKIESDYIFARIEYESDEGAEFMEKYQVPGFLSLLLIDGQGNKLKNLPRTLSPKNSWRPFKRLSNYP